MRCRNLVFDAPATFQSVHYGHHHIADNEIGHILDSQPHPLFTVRGCNYVVVGPHQLTDKELNIPVIVDNEDNGLVLIEGNVRIDYFKFGLDILLIDFLTDIDCSFGHMPYRQGHRENRAFVQRTVYGDAPPMQLYKCLGERQSYTGTLGMDTIDLIEPIEYVAEVSLAGPYHRIRTRQ